MKRILFLDTSALAKLYLEEAGREDVQGAVNNADEVAVCAIAWTEMCSLLARREREKTLTALERKQVLDALEADFAQLRIVQVDEALTRHAGTLTHSFALRALDALQLAAVLELKPLGEVEFLTFDLKLLEGAQNALGQTH